MLTRLFRFTLFFAGLFLLTSCFAYRDIEVSDFKVDNINMMGTKIVLDFSVTVTNPNRAFVITSSEGDLNLSQQPFAAGQLVQPISVAAKSEQRCSGQLQLTIKDLMAALQMGFESKSWDLSSFIFTGDLKIRSAWVKKTIRLHEVPLTQLIKDLR